MKHPDENTEHRDDPMHPADDPRVSAYVLAELEGDELARFEMGSTVVLVFPQGTATPREDLSPGMPVRLGNALGRFGA